jgi:hypothetical protein
MWHHLSGHTSILVEHDRLRRSHRRRKADVLQPGISGLNILEEGDEFRCGELDKMSDGKRVKVLLTIMGRQVPVEMDQSAVEVVE